MSGKCAYCRSAIVAEEPRRTEDGLCCWQCWQFQDDEGGAG